MASQMGIWSKVLDLVRSMDQLLTSIRGTQYSHNTVSPLECNNYLFSSNGRGHKALTVTCNYTHHRSVSAAGCE